MLDLFESRTDTLDRITRCLSLIQPWAMLVVIGAKMYETRSWQTPYRGWIAIHASKGFPVDCRDLCDDEPFRSALHHKAAGGEACWGDLPLGKVIGAAKLADCISTNHWTPAEDSDEYRFGNYGPNRFAWKFDEVKLLKQPFECRGSLSIWKLPQPITPADFA